MSELCEICRRRAFCFDSDKDVVDCVEFEEEE
jgi:hypothetical protein